MTSKDNRSADAAPSTSSDRLLRERAEEVVRENAISSPEGQEPLSLQETRHTLQELRVHQIELEMQNEELRRTQVELDRERERYFDLYDLAPVGYCTIYETGMIKEANLTAGNLLGVTRSALVRQPFTAFIQKEDLDIYYLHNKPLFETGAPQVYELRMVKKDTVPFWARLEATRAEDADGTMLCRVTVTDITKRKKAEEEIKSNLEELKRSKALIQQSNSLLEAIMASPNNIVVFALDKDYRYLAFNQNHQKTMLAIWGADIEIGANMLDYITYPADRNKAKLNFDRALAGEHFVIIEAYGDDDLQRRYYEDHYSPIREEGNSFIGLTVFLFDITDRRIMEKALQESEQRFRHVSELITDFAYSCIKSPDGPFKIDWLTGAVEKITGYTANEIRDLTCWRPLVIEDDLPLFDHDVVGLAPGEWARSEIRIRKKDGEIVWLASFAQCFTDQHLPAYHRIYGACRDITERKHAEQALVKKSEDLARSNADLAQFAYVASHDLQEPLRTITRFVQLLEKRYQGKLDQDADEFIGFIVGGTKRMQQIINDLLAYSRVNTRREPPNIVKIDDEIQRAMQNINYVLEESGGTIIYGEMPSIIADESQMTQLFQNMIGNALKFRGEEAPRVEISAVRKGDDWIFSVRDNGIGIDPQYKDRIFEIFQRLHTCEEYPGTGIGLAIAKKIVERHQGHIWVDSQPGKGSTFNFTLPVDAKNA